MKKIPLVFILTSGLLLNTYNVIACENLQIIDWVTNKSAATGNQPLNSIEVLELFKGSMAAFVNCKFSFELRTLLPFPKFIEHKDYSIFYKYEIESDMNSVCVSKYSYIHEYETKDGVMIPEQKGPIDTACLQIEY